MANKSLSATEIKKLLKERETIIGADRTLKALKLGNVETVIVTSNCDPKVKKDIDYCADLSKSEVIKIKHLNDELGIICKKPFAISVLSVLKGKKK